MSLPRIQTTAPVVEPATEEKTYPDVFLNRIMIQSSPGKPSMCRINYSPYNYDTGEKKERNEVICYNNLLAEAQTRAEAGKPALMQAVQALLAATQEIMLEQ